MKKLIVTGASGFVGWNLLNHSQQEWQIYAVTHSKSIAFPGVRTMAVDLCNQAQVKQLFETVEPDGVIHAAAQSDPNYCQQNQVETDIINTAVPIDLAKRCADLQIPYVFTSTDLVFDGTKGNYSDTDEVNPVNHYGEQKARAEEQILQAYTDAVVCRMPLMFGDGGPNGKSFMQPFLQKMRNGEALQLFFDEYRSAASGRAAAAGLFLALEGFKGIYHMGGREKLSRYDFGLLLQQVFALPQATITPCSQKDVKMAAPRPADVSMDSSKAYALGYNPLSAEQELRRLIGVV